MRQQVRASGLEKHSACAVNDGDRCARFPCKFTYLLTAAATGRAQMLPRPCNHNVSDRLALPHHHIANGIGFSTETQRIGRVFHVATRIDIAVICKDGRTHRVVRIARIRLAPRIHRGLDQLIKFHSHLVVFLVRNAARLWGIHAASEDGKDQHRQHIGQHDGELHRNFANKRQVFTLQAALKRIDKTKEQTGKQCGHRFPATKDHRRQRQITFAPPTYHG